MAWPGPRSELVLRWGRERGAARFRSAELALAFRWSRLLAVNAGLPSWPRWEPEYVSGGALLYFFDAPV